MATAKTFTNYSNEDFSHKWDGDDYDFPASQSMMLEAGLALHFAKHLAVRELNKAGTEVLGKLVIENEMKKALGLGDTIEAENDTKLAQALLNKNAKEEVKEEVKEDSKDLAEFEGK